MNACKVKCGLPGLDDLLGAPWTGGEALSGPCVCVPVPAACGDVIVLTSLSLCGCLFGGGHPRARAFVASASRPSTRWLAKAKALNVERISQADEYHPRSTISSASGPEDRSTVDAAAHSFETPAGRPITAHGRDTDLKHGGRPRPNQRFPAKGSRRGRSVGWRLSTRRCASGWHRALFFTWWPIGGVE